MGLPVYREKPVDLALYQAPREAMNCHWCAFSTGLAGELSKCKHPRNRYTAGGWLSIVGPKYPDLDCPGYRPTLLTRLLRRVGLRKAVMR